MICPPFLGYPGAALAALSAQIGELIVISSPDALAAAFPEASGVHTVDKQTIFVAQDGAPWALDPGISIAVDDPGSIVTLGGEKVLITGDVAGPLLHGELVITGLRIRNDNAGGSDILLEAPSGRPIKIEEVSLLGQNAGTVRNCPGISEIHIGLEPGAPGATGLIVDGVIGAIRWDACAAIAPGGAPYIGWTYAATCVINIIARYEAGLFVGAPTDAMIFVDPAATLPGGPVPTNVFGFEVTGCSMKFGAALFAGSRNETDIGILSSNNPGGRSSTFIGDVEADTTVTATPSPIVQAYGLADTWEVVPENNDPTIAPDDVSLTLTLPLSQRHSLDVVSRQDWSLQYDGPEDGKVAPVSWRASATRNGGPAIVQAQLEYNDGGGWVGLPKTCDTALPSSSAPVAMGGRTVIASTDNGDRFRLVSKTDTVATDTHWHAIEVSKGI